MCAARLWDVGARREAVTVLADGDTVSAVAAHGDGAPMLRSAPAHRRAAQTQLYLGDVLLFFSLVPPPPVEGKHFHELFGPRPDPAYELFEYL